MAAAQHTERWEAVGSLVRTSFAHGDPEKRGMLVAEVPGHTDEAKARARLIAAAPELLEVLQAAAAFLGGAKDRLGRPDPGASDDMRAARERIRELADRYEVAGGHHTYIDQCAALMRAAIAKATGGAA